MNAAIVMVIGGVIGSIIMMLLYREKLSQRLLLLIGVVGTLSLIDLFYQEGIVEWGITFPLVGVILLLYFLGKKLFLSFDTKS